MGFCRRDSIVEREMFYKFQIKSIKKLISKHFLWFAYTTLRSGLFTDGNMKGLLIYIPHDPP